MKKIKKLINKLSYTQTIALGFISLILIGAVILCMPFSTRSGISTPFLDALFTATSATCVTGLVLYDTYTHWSPFGQGVILFLIQIGGIGFMTIITMFAIFMKRRIGLHERMLLMQTSGNLQLSGVVRLIKHIVIVSLGIEAVGAVLLSIRFIPQMGFLSGVYNAIFHSVSAFCNAGFDLMGKYEQFSSLTGYADDTLVVLTIALLVVIGGTGFIVWEDIGAHKWRLKDYELHSKLALAATLFLILTGWLLFFIFENNGLLEGLNNREKAITTFFQSVSTRTAGYNILDTAELSESSSFLTIVLMLIGGSSGSTAGGIKTTTFAVLILSAIASARRKRDVTVFLRRIDDSIVREAGTFATVFLMVTVVATLLLCALEDITLREGLFEAASAIGTTGLSMGITPALSSASKVVIISLMFIGRVGWMTLVFALAGKYHDPPTKRVAEKVLIG